MKKTDDPSYRLLTTRYFRKQAKQLADQMLGLRESDDIEFVHRARVACRRMRAVLQMSRDCFDGKQFKLWRKEIRKLLKGLGDARDKDVQTEFLWDVVAGLNDRTLLPGIARVVVGLERAREELQPTVIASVDRAEQVGLIDDLLETSKKTLSELEGEQVQLTGRELFTRLEEHIAENVNEFLEHQDCLDDPMNEEGHHEMRIAAKQLRYTMEICRPAYQGQLDDFVATVKRVQTLLGDIHDCDVWVEHLAVTLGEEGKRLAEDYGHHGRLTRLMSGIEYLRVERREERVRLFEDLVGYWRELRQEAYWDGLIDLISSSALRGSVPPAEDGEEAAETDEEQAAADLKGQEPDRPAFEASAGNWT